MLNKTKRGLCFFGKEISPDICLAISLFLLLITVLVAGSFNHFRVKCPLINDEAVELLQGTGIPLDKFHFFAPGESYPQGFADIIESFVPYMNRAMSSAYFPAESEEALIHRFRLLALTAYVAAVIMFAVAVWRIWGGFWPLAAGLVLGLSSCTLILNHILTRNGISIFWSTSVLLLLTTWPGWKDTSDSKRNLRITLLLGFLLFMGCWTYTSFRLLTVALYGAFLVDWLRFDRSAKSFYMIGDSGVAFLAVLIVMITRDDSTLSYFLNRGNYALGGGMDYVRLLVPTFFSPWYRASGENPFFLTEDVHNMLSHSVLSIWLGAFWAIGFLGAWLRRDRFLQFIALVYAFGMGVCALAGPNVKYLLVFFPFTVWLSIAGIRFCFEWLGKKTGSLLPGTLGVCCLLGAVVTGEVRDAFVRFPSDVNHFRNSAAESMAGLAIELSTTKQGMVYVQPGVGFDIVFWKTKWNEESGKLSLHASKESLQQLLESSPPPPDSVLILDYPSQMIGESLNGWMPPQGLEIINIYDRITTPRAGH